MVHNKDKYAQAMQFRKRGFTYSEIAKICDVSKGTVSNWLAQESFSKQITKDNSARAARDNQKRILLLNKAKKAERAIRYAEAIKSAETEFKHYKTNPLFIAGLSMYIADGDCSKSSQIRLSTKSETVHAVFIKFCIEYLGVEKKEIKFWLLLSGKTSMEKAMRHWSRRINLPFTRFGKTQFVNPNSRPLHNGTGNTIIGNTVLKRKLVRWTELAAKEVLK